MRRVLTVFGLLALTGACETMSPDECRVADWRALGYQDGAEGTPLDKYSAREKSCAKAGFVAQFDPYMAGRTEGLRAFCHPERGFRAALNGYEYQGVCPASAEPDFLFGYNDGRLAFQALQAVDSLNSDIDSLKSRLDGYEDDMRHNRRKFEDPKSTPEEKEKAKKRIDELRDDRKSAERDLRDKQDDLYWRENDLARARDQIGLRWGAW